MIKLQKGPAPAVLAANGAQWTKTLVDKIDAGEEPTNVEKTRYRHADIKSALVAETRNKCAYCESRLQHIHHGDVEHIYPKSLDKTLTFSWNNLTLACEVCNQNKSNKDPLVQNIIDPYQLDPEEHLMFVGGLVFSKGTPHGTASRVILELHRAELVEMRNDQIEKIMGVYVQAQDEKLPFDVRKALFDDVRARETDSSAPYAAMARCLFEQLEPPVPPAGP